MALVTIVGLGPGDARLLTREAWEILSAAPVVYARTAKHPTLAGLPKHVQIVSFDDVYEAVRSLDKVYATIAERILQIASESENVIYAVPGSPAVAEETVNLIRAAGVPMRTVHGLSFVEPVLDILGRDALPGTHIADAIEIAARYHPPFNTGRPVLVAQLYSRALASDVKLTLVNAYPDDHRVALVHSAGTDDAAVEWLPLRAVDHSDMISHLTALYVPPLVDSFDFVALSETVAHLRAPDGCPWDREQSHASLRTNLLEETYEVLTAIDAEDTDALAEELGDLLLQIVLQTQIAVDDSEFHMADVTNGINTKLIRRHPHVFGEVSVDGVDAVIHNWEVLKAQERSESGDVMHRGVLSGVPRAMPALAQAEAYQARAARIGFDWPSISGVTAKLHEEIAEVESAQTPERLQAEMGDLLFAVVNWARWLGVEPESALREANARFRRRFEWIEARVAAREGKMSAMTLEELEELWEAAKAALDVE